MEEEGKEAGARARWLLSGSDENLSAGFSPPARLPIFFPGGRDFYVRYRSGETAGQMEGNSEPLPFFFFVETGFLKNLKRLCFPVLGESGSDLGTDKEPFQREFKSIRYGQIARRSTPVFYISETSAQLKQIPTNFFAVLRTSKSH